MTNIIGKCIPNAHVSERWHIYGHSLIFEEYSKQQQFLIANYIFILPHLQSRLTPLCMALKRLTTCITMQRNMEINAIWQTVDVLNFCFGNISNLEIIKINVENCHKQLRPVKSVSFGPGVCHAHLLYDGTCMEPTKYDITRRMTDQFLFLLEKSA